MLVESTQKNQLQIDGVNFQVLWEPLCDGQVGFEMEVTSN